MGVEEKEEVVVDVVVSVGAFEVGIVTSLTGSLTGAVGELGDLIGPRLSSSSLVEGPRASIEESLSEPRDSSDDDGEVHFRLWRVTGRAGGLRESSEDVGLGGLYGGEPGEKLRWRTLMLEIRGVSGLSR